MNTVEVGSLCKSFDGRPVLKELAMTVGQGDIYGFLGPNGTGKTTTLRILVGLLRADSGNIRVLGVDPEKKSDQLKQWVNMLPESQGFYGWMRATDYLGFFAGLYGLRLSGPKSRQLLARVGLDTAENRSIRSFSRGMKQRLGIARSLLNEPHVLFLDEPTNGLDPKGRRDIHDLLLGLNLENDITIVLSTHILDDVQQLCNRIGILFDAKLQYEGRLNKDLEKLYLDCTQKGMP